MIKTSMENGSEFEGLGAASLSKLMRLGTKDESPWRPEELSMVVRHLLRTPISREDLGPLVNLEGVAPGSDSLNEEAGASPKVESISYFDLFTSEAPVLQTLVEVNRFAKAHWSAPGGLIPAPAAALLYYLSIASARIHHQEPISRLTPAQLDQGLSWLEAEPWLDSPVRALIQAYRRRLVPQAP